MRALWTLLPMVVPLYGCAAGGTGSESSSEPLSWPVGNYEIEGTIEYRKDTEWTTHTTRDEYYAELTVESDTSLRLFTSAGICEDRVLNEISRDRSNRQRTFRCGEATYVLRPIAQTVRGSMRVPVSESFRTRGPCIEYSTTTTGQRVCVQYSWVTQTRHTTKRTELRIIKISDSP